jgi:hypothetical protein
MLLKNEDPLLAQKLQWRIVLWSGPEDPNLDVSGDGIQLIPDLPEDFVVVMVLSQYLEDNAHTSVSR